MLISMYCLRHDTPDISISLFFMADSENNKNSGAINTDLLYFVTNRNMCYFSEYVESTKVRKVLNP
jgi:hypothetical protein